MSAYSIHHMANGCIYKEVGWALSGGLLHGQKLKIIYLFLYIFSIFEVTKITLTLFFEGINWAFSWFFCSSAIVH